MARCCFVCGKGTVAGKSVSHSNKRSNRRWLANLQKIRIMVDGSPRREYVCTTCLKSDRVQRAL